MVELSSAAQAVLDAFLEDAEDTGLQMDDLRENVAAALRAAADQVVPEDYDPPRGAWYPEDAAFVDGKCVRNEDIRFQLLATATELETHQ